MTTSSTETFVTELYAATGGDNWTNNDNWLNFSVSYSEWYGVTLSRSSISAIILTSNNLQGITDGID